MSNWENSEMEVKKRPGRKPMTQEEKEAAMAARSAQKALADQMKPELLIQFQGTEINVDTLVETAKANFRAEKKRTLITALKLYIKPEDQKAYYVVNEKFTGEISF